MIRDVRNLSQTQKTLELDCSTGILMPLFDADTNMLFLAGKGDTTILYMELTDREPFLIEGLRHSGISYYYILTPCDWSTLIATSTRVVIFTTSYLIIYLKVYSVKYAKIKPKI